MKKGLVGDYCSGRHCGCSSYRMLYAAAAPNNNASTTMQKDEKQNFSWYGACERPDQGSNVED